MRRDQLKMKVQRRSTSSFVLNFALGIPFPKLQNDIGPIKEVKEPFMPSPPFSIGDPQQTHVIRCQKPDLRWLGCFSSTYNLCLQRFIDFFYPELEGSCLKVEKDCKMLADYKTVPSTIHNTRKTLPRLHC